MKRSPTRTKRGDKKSRAKRPTDSGNVAVMKETLSVPKMEDAAGDCSSSDSEIEEVKIRRKQSCFP